MNGKFHGYGILKLHRGKTPKDKFFDIYEGMFLEGRMEGEGIYTYATGDVVSGFFSNNKLNGIGRAKNGFVEKDKGFYYSGMFRDNRFHGFGFYKYPDKSYYVGGFEDGKMKGLGILVKGKNYTFIDGINKAGKPEKVLKYKIGKNDFIRRDGENKSEKTPLSKIASFLYGGELENEKPSGVGFSITDNKVIYYGEWSESLKNGIGIQIENNGNFYLGEWKNGEPDGEGLLLDKDGDTIYSGKWENGAQKNSK